MSKETHIYIALISVAAYSMIVCLNKSTQHEYLFGFQRADSKSQFGFSVLNFAHWLSESYFFGRKSIVCLIYFIYFYYIVLSMQIIVLIALNNSIY